MRELGLTGLSDDGRYLLVRDAGTGEEARLELDDSARAILAAAGAPSPSTAPATDPRVSSTRQPSSDRQAGSTGRTESLMEITLSPREIQTRIRRGESPEQVAEAARVEVERIMGYAVPVLAEREFMCEQARKTVVRRKHVGGSAALLGTLVDEGIATRGGVPEDARWDSWRREDGRWSVTVLPSGASDPATFLFDVQGRYLLPADEVAHDLVADVALPDTSDMAIADAVRSPVAEPVSSDEEVTERHARVSSLKEARDRRALEQLALTDEAADDDVDAAPHDEQLTFDDAEPEGAPARGPVSHEQLVDEVEHEVVAAVEQQRHRMAVPDDGGPHDVEPRKKRSERRRVPSWDEIMFGGSKD